MIFYQELRKTLAELVEAGLITLRQAPPMIGMVLRNSCLD